MAFQAIYYQDENGREPVRGFVNALPASHRAAVLFDIDRLNSLHPGMPHLPAPHSSQVAGELRELRCRTGGGHQYRILYARSDRLIILLHAFRKTTQKIPQQHLDTAIERWNAFKQRMNETPRRPPRAAGRDAP